MDRIRSINGIFEKGVGRDYTDNALLYQDILKYCLKQKQESVKIFELSNWLLRNNRELVSCYDSTSTKRNTPYNARVHAHRTRIENKVNDLIALRLVERSGTVKGDKNNLETPPYSYTKLGHLPALIMKSSLLDQEIGIEKRKQAIDKTKIIDKQKEQQSVNAEIFNLFDFTFFKTEENSASTAIFYSHFFRKCKEKGIFDILVTHIADILH